MKNIFALIIILSNSQLFSQTCNCGYKIDDYPKVYFDNNDKWAGHHIKQGSKIMDGIGVYTLASSQDLPNTKLLGKWVNGIHIGSSIDFYEDGSSLTVNFTNNHIDGLVVYRTLFGTLFYQVYDKSKLITVPQATLDSLIFQRAKASLTIVSQKGNCTNGKGKATYENGDVYDGHWKDNKRNGTGVLHYDGGLSVYEGEWDNNFQNGQGKMCTGISSAEGNFKDGLLEGMATTIDPFGIKYVGNFHQGIKSGQGSLFWEENNKLLYTGSFEYGAKNGFGIEYGSNSQFYADKGFSDNFSYTFEGDFFYGKYGKSGKYVHINRSDKGVFTGDSIICEWKEINGKISAKINDGNYIYIGEIAYKNEVYPTGYGRKQRIIDYNNGKFGTIEKYVTGDDTKEQKQLSIANQARREKYEADVLRAKEERLAAEAKEAAFAKLPDCPYCKGTGFATIKHNRSYNIGGQTQRTYFFDANGSQKYSDYKTPEVILYMSPTTETIVCADCKGTGKCASNCK